ncbi:hypothetical protein A6D6_00253 [Alcanivorax xiamenensis]|uniref:DUF7822 domain-containing protein n=1 Tax=Alcanivorax xiamenensis TaxID=1177156 RepID=A0ABQ6YDW3_9GAMM|nr:hypothetical protein [Alcanivorax xiamenensis]KAF0808544.1 hypothetical protein A6D6_00253 [Alcanivorax xiamenensis]
MANRSYLYATDRIPARAPDHPKPVVRGLSEWGYAIPLSYRLLVSVDTVMCPSMIWELDDDLALAGDYDKGVTRLCEFLARIDWPEAEALVEETKAFLLAPENRADHVVLEAAEILDMADQPLAEESRELLAGLADLDEEMERTLRHLSQVKPSAPGPLARMLGLKPADPIAPVRELGLGNWSNVLYFDFSED